MKKILLIVTHPKKESLSFTIADRYKETRKALGDRVEVLDLYREEQQQPFFAYEDRSKVATPQMAYYQEKISEADELVFVFPYWWGSYPAILHNFIDWNLSKGFAFEYLGSLPKGLLRGKRVTVFATTGAPKFYYALTGANRRIKNTFKEQVVSFCGMKLSSFNIYGGVNTAKRNIEAILQDVAKVARRSS